MSFEEFERLPDEENKLELLEGTLVRLPPPKRNHMHTAQRLFLLLHQIVLEMSRSNRDLGLGETHMEMGYWMGSDPGTWLVPDVSITHAGQSGADYYEGPPLVAMEVASESQSAAYLEAKAQKYLALGSREVWLIYPTTKHVWVCRAGERTMELQTEAIRSPLLPGAEVRLADIF